uniref:Aminotransferase class I/classII large domain-containing protein n=2 Tax=Lutzomyia longipalpis TaxID=7200 RepID=A0A1B0CVE1_LUTLO
MEMAKFLSQAYGGAVLQDNLILTCGAHHGFHLVLSTLLDLNGVVFIDEITYTNSLGICRQFSTMQIVPVAFDLSTGVDFDDLQCKVKSRKFTPCEGKPFWGVYFTMSVFHNPTGVTYSPDLCMKLIELARQEDMLIVSDDASNLLSYNFPEKPPKRLFAYDNYENDNYLGHVVSTSSFSKLLGQGIRLGWMECPPRIMEIFNNSAILYGTGSFNHFTSHLITTFLREGLCQKQYESILVKYRERLNLVEDYLKNHLPKEIKVKHPRGGLFLWIEFPLGFPAEAFEKYLIEKHQMFVLNGSYFSVNGDKFQNCIRFVCTYYDLPTLKVASEIFCESYKQFSH